LTVLSPARAKWWAAGRAAHDRGVPAGERPARTDPRYVSVNAFSLQTHTQGASCVMTNWPPSPLPFRLPVCAKQCATESPQPKTSHVVLEATCVQGMGCLIPEESVQSRLKSLAPFQVVRAPHLRGCYARWLRPTPGQPSACAGAQRSARALPPWWAVPTDSRCPLRCGRSCPSSHVALPAAVAPEYPGGAPGVP
jgi:hypothetical protein